MTSPDQKIFTVDDEAKAVLAKLPDSAFEEAETKLINLLQRNGGIPLAVAAIVVEIKNALGLTSETDSETIIGTTKIIVNAITQTKELVGSISPDVLIAKLKYSVRPSE